jgi:hypothetical protein
MKWTTTIVLAVITLWMVGAQIQQCVMFDYRFEKNYEYAWNLADKSSTIEAKATYIRQFVSLLESNQPDFAEYNAKWLYTPDNSFAMNLAALKTLRDRLQEVMTMDVKSFEYQTAIQQITAQEQGEAGKLISTIKGCWLKEKYPLAWNWYVPVWIFLWLILAIATCFAAAITATEF